jgi:uncharacterized protein
VTAAVAALGALLAGLAATLYASVGHAGASGYLAVMALLGVAPATMRPAALVLNVVVACIGTTTFARAGHLRWSLLWPLLVGSIPAAYLGGTLTLPGTWYRAIVGAVLLASAARLLGTARQPDVAPTGEPSRLARIILGIGLGLLSGLTGVGGGIFLSPILLALGWANLRITAATSAAFILANSVAGLLGQGVAPHALPTWLLAWVPAVIIGGALGARAGARRLDATTLRRLLAAVLVLAGVKLVFGG